MCLGQARTQYVRETTQTRPHPFLQWEDTCRRDVATGTDVLYSGPICIADGLVHTTYIYSIASRKRRAWNVASFHGWLLSSAVCERWPTHNRARMNGRPRTVLPLCAVYPHTCTASPSSYILFRMRDYNSFFSRTTRGCWWNRTQIVWTLLLRWLGVCWWHFCARFGTDLHLWNVSENILRRCVWTE